MNSRESAIGRRRLPGGFNPKSTISGRLAKQRWSSEMGLSNIIGAFELQAQGMQDLRLGAWGSEGNSGIRGENRTQRNEKCRSSVLVPRPRFLLSPRFC